MRTTRRPLRSITELLESRRLLAAANLVNANDLDPTFGSAGRESFDFGGASEVVGGVLTDAQGRMLVVEHHLNPDGPPQTTSSRLLRANAEGSPDASFGTGGFVDLPGDTAFNYNRSMVATPDGHLLIAGSTRVGSVSTFAGTDDFLLQQFNADGSVDTSFGTNGRVVADIAGREDLGVEVLRQDDGKIVVVGYEQHTFLSRVFQTPHTALVRFNPDGTLDTTFGTGGKVITEIPGFDANRAASAVLQPDGKIVVVGSAIRNEGDGSIVRGDEPQAFIMRYDRNGQLDPTFSRDGIVVTRTNGAANDVVIGRDGGFVVAGWRENKKSHARDFAVSSFKFNGSPDGRFGHGGIAIASAKDLGTGATDANAATGVAAEFDGSVVAVGQAGNSRMALVRFDPRGKLDPDFGEPVLTDVPLNTNTGVFLQDDGKIVTWAGGDDVTLARYMGVTVKPFAEVTHGTLRITGTDGADDTRVFVTPAPTFRTLSVVQNGFEQQISESDVKRIQIDAGDGDDRVEIDAGLLIPSTIDGGTGNDTLSGGGDVDRISGGVGRDTITGNAGRDRLVGGFDDDTFFARDGEVDVISGGAGNDLGQLDARDRATSVEDDVAAS